MTTAPFTLIDLTRILVEGAGNDDGIDLEGDILDTRFADIGYESLAMLETGSRIEREYGITLDDFALSDASTPRTLIRTVNGKLTGSVSPAP